MMQAVAEEQTRDTTTPVRLVITVELILYAVLFLLALVLRTAELDSIPLKPVEAQQALASWRAIHPLETGTTIIPESPLLFLLNNFMFTILGGAEMPARLLTAFAGVGLCLTPLLFRSLFGQTRTFMFSLFLTCSPIFLIASRFNSPVIWSMLFAVFGLWAVWRYWEKQRPVYGIVATVLFIATILLTESGGLLLVLILVGAGAIALWLTALDAPNRIDGNEYLAAVRQRMAGWPWQNGILLGVLVVLVIATSFMIHLEGFSSVGALLGALLQGVSTSQVGGTPAYPLVTALFYEPFLLVFALIGLWLLSRRETFTYVERFFLGWAIMAALVSILYAGGEADHALWLIIPLAGLASYATTAMLIRDENVGLWGVNLQNVNFSDWPGIPGWGKWLMAAVTLTLLIISAIHLQSAARSLVTIPRDLSLLETFSVLVETRYAPLLRGISVLGFSVLLIIMGHLLAASAWGNMTAVQGGLLGLLIFTLASSLGSGWNAAVTNASDPLELWHGETTSSEMFLLRDTLSDLAERESNGFPLMPVTVVVDTDETITEDSVVAWALRDFSHAQFVTSVEDAQTEAVVLLQAPAHEGDAPDLGGSYVGQSFLISQIWDPQTLPLIQQLSWWAQRRVDNPGLLEKKAVLWVRQDIYNGVPLTETSSE